MGKNPRFRNGWVCFCFFLRHALAWRDKMNVVKALAINYFEFKIEIKR